MESPVDLLTVIEARLGDDAFADFLRDMVGSLPDPYTVTSQDLTDLMYDFCATWLEGRRNG